MSSRILLIEDTEDLGEMIRDILSKEGYEVIWAKDGRSGIEFYKHTNPDLIITDLVMPYMDGLEVIRCVREAERAAKIPIIILSAKATPEDQAIGIATGANLYLKKPCSGSLLLSSIQSLLRSL